MSNYITTDCDLIEVIQSAEEIDLSILADFITDNNKGRVSLDSVVRGQLDTFKRTGSLKNNSDLLIKEIQEFGGNSIINFFRGKGVQYREILDDVAEHMKVTVDKTDGAEQVEIKIMLAVAAKSMEHMSPDEQRSFFSKISGGKVLGFGPGAIASLQAMILAGGFGSFMLATTVANAVATQLIGRGLTFGANAALMRGMGAFSGPIGWAITAIWTAFDLASPAYRVTVPCALQVAYMRQKIKEATMPHCTCGMVIVLGQKFCAECGVKTEVA